MTALQNLTANTNIYQQLNENFDAVSPAGIYGRRAPSTSGLTWAYYGGRGFGNTIADGTVALTGSTTNYVVANRSTGAVSVSTVITNWNDTSNYYRLYLVVAGASTITSYTDYREFAGSGGSGSSFTGGTLTTALNEAPPVTIASAATVNIGAAASNTVLISGTTTITAFDSIAAGAIRRVRFLGALTLTHNGTSLILPAATNITTAAGDVATMESLGSGNWRCVDYAKADGTALVASGGGSGTVTSVTAQGGIETTTGTPITAAGTIQANQVVNPQTGTTYTYLTGDRAKLVTHSNAAAIAATLPQATSTFGSGWFMRVKNKGAGTLTITPTTSTIDGAATLVLTTGQWADVVSDGTNYQATTYSPSSGGGALTNFTESVNSSAPNVSTPVVQLLATNAAADVDIALTPKGSSGSLLAQIPNSAASGGNKRGARAVDWQMTRAAATQVASGNNAVIGGGSNNTSSSTTSTVAGGDTNSATGSGSTVGGGNTNVASNTYSTIAGGVGSTASGFRSSVLGGASHVASDDYAAVLGGNANTADGKYSSALGWGAIARAGYGAHCRASGMFSVVGDAQVRSFVHRTTTPDATPKSLAGDGGTPAAGTSVVLANNSVFAFEIVVSAKVATFGDRGTYKVTGQISRNASAAATQIDGTVTTTTIATIGGASTWVVTAIANTTLGSLEVRVTGAAATSIKWVANITTTEVVG